MLSRKWHAGTASVLASGLLQFLEADLRHEQGLSLPASPRPETDATYMGQNKRLFDRSLRPLRRYRGTGLAHLAEAQVGLLLKV